MIQSIVDDIKAQFTYGNMITRIILVNLFVFFVIIIVRAFSPPETGIFDTLMQNLALPSGGWELLKKPWTLFTHMILHKGIWHIGWNMLILYWFGRIVGDLAGDRRILPLYIIGGLAGAFMYLIYSQLTGHNSIAFGASGAVMCFVVTAGFLAPDYIIRLMFIGDVRMKYVAAGLVVIDLAMISEGQNTGGRFAHLGGALMGGFFVHMLRQGVDLTKPLDFNKVKKATKSSSPKPPMTVVHKKRIKKVEIPKKPVRSKDTQEKIDEILDKINASGYDSLSAEDKDFLYQASKK